MSQSEMILKLKNGDSESFMLLYDKYSNRLFSLAYGMIGNRQEAEDIVQNTFLQAYEKINDFRERSDIYTWLYIIAKNQCLRYLENKKKSAISSLEKLIYSVHSNASEEELTNIEKQFYINQVKEGCLLGLLRCLSFYQRVVFILNVLLDVNVKTVSVIIDKSETATRTLSHRAKQNIKAFLCKNCSLYDKTNHCHCENLIDFSLKQGWIDKPTKSDLIEYKIPSHDFILQEINDFKKIASLYSGLPNRQLSEETIQKVRDIIKHKEFKIFCDKKVK